MDQKSVLLAEYARRKLRLLTTIVREDAGVARGEVKGASGCTANEDCRTCFATMEIKPLLGLQMMSVHMLSHSEFGMSHIRMPVQLAKTTRLQLDKRGGDRRGDGEVAGVDDP